MVLPAATEAPRAELPPMKCGVAGAALVTAIVIALAATLAAHALLLLARAELSAARAHRDLVLVEAARSRVLRSWSESPADSSRLPDTLPLGGTLPIGSTELVGNVEARVTARRLSAHLWWMLGFGAVGDLRDDVAWVVRRVDTDSVLTGVARAVEVDADPTVFGLPAGGAGEPCPLPETTVVAAEAGPPQDVRTVLGPGAVPSWELFLPPVPDSVGVLSPGPDLCGVGWNWYDPLDPGCPVSAVARHAAGSLRLTGGQGAAVLLVDGDLELDGTTLYGLVVTTGGLRLVHGARVIGLARVGETVVVDGASSVFGSECWARSALEGSEIVRPQILSGRLRVPPPSTP